VREISETECFTRSRRLGGVGGGVEVLKERKRYSDGRYKNVVTVASPTKVVVPRRTNANSSRSARVNTSRPTTKTGQIRYRKHILRYG
jgi:hypothetical protein